MNKNIKEVKNKSPSSQGDAQYTVGRYGDPQAQAFYLALALCLGLVCSWEYMGGHCFYPQGIQSLFYLLNGFRLLSGYMTNCGDKLFIAQSRVEWQVAWPEVELDPVLSFFPLIHPLPVPRHSYPRLFTGLLTHNITTCPVKTRFQNYLFLCHFPIKVIY